MIAGSRFHFSHMEGSEHMVTVDGLVIEIESNSRDAEQGFRKFASLSYQWDVDNFLCSVCAKWLRVLYRYTLTFLTVSGIVNEAYRKHRKYKATPHNAIKEKSGEQPTMQK